MTRLMLNRQYNKTYNTSRSVAEKPLVVYLLSKINDGQNANCILLNSLLRMANQLLLHLIRCDHI